MLEAAMFGKRQRCKQTRSTRCLILQKGSAPAAHPCTSLQSLFNNISINGKKRNSLRHFIPALILKCANRASPAAPT